MDLIILFLSPFCVISPLGVMPKNTLTHDEITVTHVAYCFTEY